jgi:hypothetical protein
MRSLSAATFAGEARGGDCARGYLMVNRTAGIPGDDGVTNLRRWDGRVFSQVKRHLLRTSTFLAPWVASTLSFVAAPSSANPAARSKVGQRPLEIPYTAQRIIIQDGTIASGRDGVNTGVCNGDMTIRRVTFIGQCLAAINDDTPSPYGQGHCTAKPTHFSDNDYTQIQAGADTVKTNGQEFGADLCGEEWWHQAFP